MKAARYYGPGDIRVEQVPEPQPKKGQVKIKVCSDFKNRSFDALMRKNICRSLGEDLTTFFRRYDMKDDFKEWNLWDGPSCLSRVSPFSIESDNDSRTHMMLTLNTGRS